MKSAILRLLTAGLALGTFLLSCGKTPGIPDENSEDPKVEVSDITLDHSSESVKVGGTLQLTATLKPGNATDKTVIWYSLEPKVASVSESGLVTGLEVGSAIVGAKTPNGLSAECEIIVWDDEDPGPGGYVDISAITVEPSEIELNVGETFRLAATVAPDNATDKSVYWRSTSTSTASVAADGTVTANKAGTATVYAYRTTLQGQEITGSCTVTVVQKNTSIAFYTSEVHLTVGNVLYLYAVVTPENAPSANSLTWASSNEGVASVDQSGRVEALSEGTAEITASADGVSARCTVTVETIAGGNEGTGEENWK